MFYIPLIKHFNYNFIAYYVFKERLITYPFITVCCTIEFLYFKFFRLFTKFILFFYILVILFWSFTFIFFCFQYFLNFLFSFDFFFILFYLDLIKSWVPSEFQYIIGFWTWYLFIITFDLYNLEFFWSASYIEFTSLFFSIFLTFFTLDQSFIPLSICFFNLTWLDLFFEEWFITKVLSSDPLFFDNILWTKFNLYKFFSLFYLNFCSLLDAFAFRFDTLRDQVFMLTSEGFYYDTYRRIQSRRYLVSFFHDKNIRDQLLSRRFFLGKERGSLTHIYLANWFSNTFVFCVDDFFRFGDGLITHRLNAHSFVSGGDEIYSIFWRYFSIVSYLGLLSLFIVCQFINLAVPSSFYRCTNVEYNWSRFRKQSFENLHWMYLNLDPSEDLAFSAAIVNDFRAWGKYFVEHPPLELFPDKEEKVKMELFIQTDLSFFIETSFLKNNPILNFWVCIREHHVCYPFIFLRIGKILW